MSPILVSVIIPTFNRPALLAQTLRCVRAQDIAPGTVEVIVVDDGSDVEVELTALGRDGAGPLVSVIRQENQGLCAARNTGLALARGRWIAFCDDDDLWGPAKLATQLAQLGLRPRSRWCIASAVITNEALAPLLVQRAPEETRVPMLLRHANVVPGGGSGAVAERSLLVELGGFDRSLVHLGDWELWLRLAAIEAPVVVDEPLFLYRRHRGQMSLDTDAISEEIMALATRGLMSLDAPAARLPGRRDRQRSAPDATATRLGQTLLAAQGVGRDDGAVAAALVRSVREVLGEADP